MVEIFGFVIDNIWEGIYVTFVLLVVVIGFFLYSAKETLFPRDVLVIYDEQGGRR